MDYTTFYSEVVHLLDHYPDYFKENQEIVADCDALDPEFNLFFTRARQTLNNMLPGRCDENGIARFEDWLEITPDADESLEERKGQVLAKINETLPYTEITLQKMLASVVGWGHFKYKRIGALVEVVLDDESMKRSMAVYDLLQRVLPMNLHYIVQGNVEVQEQGIAVAIGFRETEYEKTEIDNFEKIAKAYKCIGTSRITKTIEVPRS